jgi:hypothetical protein
MGSLNDKVTKEEISGDDNDDDGGGGGLLLWKRASERSSRFDKNVSVRNQTINCIKSLFLFKREREREVKN